MFIRSALRSINIAKRKSELINSFYNIYTPQRRMSGIYTPEPTPTPKLTYFDAHDPISVHTFATSISVPSISMPSISATNILVTPENTDTKEEIKKVTEIPKVTESDIQNFIIGELEPALKTEWDLAADAVDDGSWEALIAELEPNPKERIIYAISDIHTEFYESAQDIYDSIQWRTATHLVLAGDIGVITSKLRIYKDFLTLCTKKYKNVVLIPGNHEYYGCETRRVEIEKILESLCQTTGVHYIQGKNVVVDGIRFIGHTLWSLIERDACAQLADFSRRVFDNQIEYVSAFVDGYRFLQSEILKSMDYVEPIVVVTHHLPSRKMIHPKFKSYSVLNSAFATDVVNSITLNRVKYWFCGHTHEYCETKVADTMIIANPVGYPDEQRMTAVSLNTYSILTK